jgi:hypothetical protein
MDVRPPIDNYKEPRNLHDRKELCVVGRGRQLFLIVQLNGRTLRVLIDSGVTGNFIHPKVTAEQGFSIIRKVSSYTLFLMDGSEISTNKGMITFKTRPLKMTTLGGHTKEIQFDLVTMGSYIVILGMPWLWIHNPRIDWWKERIIMDQCSCKGGRRAPTREKDSNADEKFLCATSDE